MTFLCGIPLEILYEVDYTPPVFFGGRCKNCPLLQNSHRDAQCPEIRKSALRLFYCAVCLWESQYTNLTILPLRIHIPGRPH